MKFFVSDSTFTNDKSKITPEKFSFFNDLISSDNDKYINAVGYSAPTSITVEGNLIVAVGDSIFKTVETTLTTSNLDSGSSFTLGKDYYIYVCDPSNGDVTADMNEVIKISLSSTYPSGYTASNSRKIGGFHYGRVRRVNAVNWNPVGTDGTTEYGTNWQTNVYTGIIPNSVWTLLHKPACDPEGMVWINGDLWVDIYLSSDAGNQGVQSTYNSTPITGTEGLHWYYAVERARRVGKRLPTYAEWCAIGLGTPPGGASGDTYCWCNQSARKPTGTHSYAVSSFNVTDAVGNVWEWLDEFIHDPTASSAGWYDVMSDKDGGVGQLYMYSNTGLHALRSCGGWDSAAYCGRRTVNCSNNPWVVTAGNGVRCVCGHRSKLIV